MIADAGLDAREDDAVASQFPLIVIVGVLDNLTRFVCGLVAIATMCCCHCGRLATRRILLRMASEFNLPDLVQDVTVPGSSQTSDPER